MNLVQTLYDRKLVTPPNWLPNNIMWLVMTGSVSYGVADVGSDIDIIGWCIPPIRMVFPHTAGYVAGFDTPPSFDQYQQHHIPDQDKGRVYDITVYSLIKYVKLCMEGNPNMVDSLFVPRRCVLSATIAGEYLREHRHAFLSKQMWPKFKGYAYSQLDKMRRSKAVGKRKASIDEHGYDLKAAYHVVRLIDEIEQILTTGDLDLERNSEQLKAIRRGDFTQNDIETIFQVAEYRLEDAKHKSALPEKPDKDYIRGMLLDILEMHYGSIDEMPRMDKYQRAVYDIRDLISKL